MNKKILYLLFLFFLNFVSAQQNDEFKNVKQYYDNQRFMLSNSFKNAFDKEQDAMRKLAMKRVYDEFMKKMDSVQNVAFIGALIKVKNNEDLNAFNTKNSISTLEKGQQIKPSSVSSKTEISEEKEVAVPEYPGGINILRNQIAQIFYYDAVNSEQKILKTNLVFVVEKDGSISTVHAEGDDFIMNRQAEIAVYLLPDKFSPANFKGESVRYRLRLPISMNFE